MGQDLLSNQILLHLNAKRLMFHKGRSIHAISNNMYIENVIVDYRDRPKNSQSKLNTFFDGMKVLHMLFSLYRNYRPLAFFSVLAAILTLIAAGMFIPLVWIPYRQTGLVERFPTLIVCGFIVLAALLVLFVGLILDKIRMKERRAFEFRLTLVESFQQYAFDAGESHEATSNSTEVFLHTL